MVKLVKEFNGLIIVDQVQTGFGRVGTKYWGHKWKGIKPDIVTMAKGIANGIPLAAVATRKEIAQSLKYSYLSTYGGGGPVPARVAMEVIKTIREQKLDENAQKLG